MHVRSISSRILRCGLAPLIVTILPAGSIFPIDEYSQIIYRANGGRGTTDPADVGERRDGYTMREEVGEA